MEQVTQSNPSTNADHGTAAFDKGLNAAIMTLAEAYLPHGYRVERGSVYAAKGSPWEHYRAEGKPVVGGDDDPATAEPNASIFGDDETEFAFMALQVQFAMDYLNTPEGKEHEAHFPEVCESMVAVAARRTCELLVSRYGDEERTRRWCLIVAMITAGRFAFAHQFGYMPPSDEYVRVGLPVVEGKLTWGQFIQRAHYMAGRYQAMRALKDALARNIGGGAEAKPTIH